MDDVKMQRRAEGARILSFESFLRRTVVSGQSTDGAHADSPFGRPDPPRPLNQRQISHRRAMLKHMQGGQS